MDQIYNSMLFMAQVPAERPAGKPAQSQESDSFQKQMEQASGKTEGKTETAVQDQPQEGPVTVEDSQELEKQMALAAMAVMQNPVVPVEQVTAPEETAARGGLCPVCGKKLTVGVEHRLEELAARPAGFRPPEAKPFESLVPLPEVIAACMGFSPAGKKTVAAYEALLQALGPEFRILREVPVADIAQAAGPLAAEGIRRLRQGQVELRAGFDGVYGTVTLLSPEEREALRQRIDKV